MSCKLNNFEIFKHLIEEENVDIENVKNILLLICCKNDYFDTIEYLVENYDVNLEFVKNETLSSRLRKYFETLNW